MFRQLFLFISIIVVATALRFDFTQGLREEGDAMIKSDETVAVSPFPGVGSTVVEVHFVKNPNTNYTFVSYEIPEGFDLVFEHDLAHITFEKFNATALTIRTEIFGFKYVSDDEGTE